LCIHTSQRKPQIRKLRRKGYVPLGGVNDLHYKRTGNIIWAKEILNLEWLFGIIIVKIREGPSLERHGREW